MTIISHNKTKAILEILERFKSNTMAYKLTIDKAIKNPKLVDGSTEIIGIQAINEYIDLFESEKQQWYYCDC